MHVGVDLPGRTVWAKIWRAASATTACTCSTPTCPENSEADRDIAHQLYGGDRRTRIEQEILLGVGGVRALAALGCKPTVWHINEGHAAFLVLERIRRWWQAGHVFRAAWKRWRPTRCSPPTPRSRPATTTSPTTWSALLQPVLQGGRPRARGLLGMGRVGGAGGAQRIQHDRWPCAARASTTASRASTAACPRASAATCGRRLPPPKPDGLRHQRRCTCRPSSPPTGTRPSTATWARLAAPPHRPELLEQRAAHPGPDLLEHPPVAQGPDAAPGAQPGHASSTCATRAPRPTWTACCATPIPQSERADHRLRAPLRHLQARRPAVQQPGLAARDHFRRAAAGAVHLRRQGAPGRRTRAGN
jgi:hypothetical protein